MRAIPLNNKSVRNKRLVILCALCGAAVLIIMFVASFVSASNEQTEFQMAREVKATESAVTVPDIPEEEKTGDIAPASSAAIAPDSGEQRTADF
jgi:hypothetical protein